MISNRQMEVFMAVYEENSMTKAGKKLYMTQPAVSQTIREIEEENGVHLFERLGSKLYVTQAGETLYFHVKRIFNLYDDMKSAMNLNEGTKEIRVGANISVGTAFIRDYIRKFRKIYPNIEVYVKVSRSAVLERELESHKLDFALMEDLVFKAEQMVQIPYYKDRIVVVAAPDHPLVQKEAVLLKELKKEKFLLREKGAGVRDKFDYILKLNDIYIEPLWESATTKALVNAVREGFGISVLPYLLVQEYLEDHVIAELKLQDVSLSRNLNIVYHKDKILTKPMEDFIHMIQDMAAASEELHP